MSAVRRCEHITPVVALATSPPTSGIQAIHTRLPFVGRYCSCIPSGWVYAGHYRWPPSTAVCWLSNMHCQEFVDRCFTTAGPTLWNSLPEHLRQPDIGFEQFKRSLKTWLPVAYLRGGHWAMPPQKNVLAPKCHLKRRLTGLRRILLGTDRPTLILFPAWNLSY